MKETKYVAFCTQKGGAGKTTLTVLLASYLHYALDKNIAIIDCDYPQHSILDMRKRDISMIGSDPFYNNLAQTQFKKLNKKGYTIVDAKFETALIKAEEIMAKDNSLDYIFFDLPGTVNVKGLIQLIVAMDYIFTPITADSVVLQSSLNFATVINEKLLTANKTPLKAIYMFWNMVDRREKSELYEMYERVIHELGIPIMETTIPDSKRFRRELNQVHRPVFRSTLFPIDKKLIKYSHIDELSKEFLNITV